MVFYSLFWSRDTNSYLTMKRLLILLPLFLAFATVNAQDNTEGEIIYDQVITLNFDKSKMPPEAQQWIEAMPKEIKDQKQLVFNSTSSVYKNYENPEEDAAAEEGGMTVMIRRNMPDDFTAVNLKEGTYADQKEVFGRIFLIKDELKDYQWKMTGEQEEIAGYHCMVATTVDPEDSMEVKAWFTPQIPVAGGPGAISNLPGMVMQMELTGGQLRRGPGNSVITLTASNVDFRKVKKSELKGPEKGKEVTRDEFMKIVKEKMEEMREQMGNRRGGGHMRVITN